MYTVLKIGRHYKISSDIRKIDNGKRFVSTFGNFVLPNGVNICSVNLDRLTTFLTLLLCLYSPRSVTPNTP